MAIESASATAKRSDSRPLLELGFRFYGAGNVGDDLMLSGFLEAVGRLGLDYRICGQSEWDGASQATRFPGVDWSAASGREPPECWAGVGDTPFQVTSGEWFLDFLTDALAKMEGDPRKVLIGVGAESEIARRQAEFAEIANSFDRIFSRDEHSSQVLLEKLRFPAARLFTGADLANVSLAKLAAELQEDRRFRTGIIVASDTLSPGDLFEIRRFIMKQPAAVAFIANEVRLGPKFERGIHREFTRFPALAARWKMRLRVPPYASGSLADLVRPVWQCETLFSSRYHGLLAGAWAGCKLAAIGRSSKVTALASQLDIPCATPPLTLAKIEAVHSEATVVAPGTLQRLAEQAIQGVRFVLGDQHPSMKVR